MNSFTVEERDDLVPVCPYCDKELDRFVARKLSATIFSRRIVYCCPYCRKVLGVTHRKGMLAN